MPVLNRVAQGADHSILADERDRMMVRAAVAEKENDRSYLPGRLPLGLLGARALVGRSTSPPASLAAERSPHPGHHCCGVEGAQHSGGRRAPQRPWSCTPSRFGLAPVLQGLIAKKQGLLAAAGMRTEGCPPPSRPAGFQVPTHPPMRGSTQQASLIRCLD